MKDRENGYNEPTIEDILNLGAEYQIRYARKIGQKDHTKILSQKPDIKHADFPAAETSTSRRDKALEELYTALKKPDLTHEEKGKLWGEFSQNGMNEEAVRYIQSMVHITDVHIGRTVRLIETISADPERLKRYNAMEKYYNTISKPDITPDEKLKADREFLKERPVFKQEKLTDAYALGCELSTRRIEGYSEEDNEALIAAQKKVGMTDEDIQKARRVAQRLDDDSNQTPEERNKKLAEVFDITNPRWKKLNMLIDLSWEIRDIMIRKHLN
jgi:hypothetical protein